MQYRVRFTEGNFSREEIVKCNSCSGAIEGVRFYEEIAEVFADNLPAFCQVNELDLIHLAKGTTELFVEPW